MLHCRITAVKHSANMQGEGNLKKKVRRAMLKKKPEICWDEIVGLDNAKQVCAPVKRQTSVVRRS